MKNRWLILFICIALLHLFASVVEHNFLANITKPLLLAVLFYYYRFSTNTPNKLLYSALAFSWLGDVLLIFQKENSLFFLFGLLSFLTAHIFYVLYFRQNGMHQLKPFLIGIIAVYSVLFFAYMQPKLGVMKIPVVVYTLVISAMLISAIHCKVSMMPHKLFSAGAILFAASDSVLAYNKFYASISHAGFIIMFTYIAAQYLIVRGAILHSKENH
jgi:uncharacterized membrane protein YhhN